MLRSSRDKVSFTFLKGHSSLGSSPKETGIWSPSVAVKHGGLTGTWDLRSAEDGCKHSLSILTECLPGTLEARKVGNLHVVPSNEGHSHELRWLISGGGEFLDLWHPRRSRPGEVPGGQLKTRKGQSGWADGRPDRHPNNESEGKRKWGLGPAFVRCFVTNSCCQASHADLALEWCKKTKVKVVSSGERGGGRAEGQAEAVGVFSTSRKLGSSPPGVCLFKAQ